MLIDCPHCASKVHGAVKGENNVSDEEGNGYKHVLVECPSCKATLLGVSEQYMSGYDGENYEISWSPLDRLWPAPDSELDWKIPEIASISLDEARQCLKAKCYSACAVMCGRALEGVCKDLKANTRNLADGLKYLKDQEIIDARLFEWGEALRKHRNLGAHASVERVTKEDAQDLVDFSIAICDYIYVLSAKFNDFKERQKKT
jgi:hypothetical protein